MSPTQLALFLTLPQRLGTSETAIEKWTRRGLRRDLREFGRSEREQRWAYVKARELGLGSSVLI